MFPNGINEITGFHSRWKKPNVSMRAQDDLSIWSGKVPERFPSFPPRFRAPPGPSSLRRRGLHHPVPAHRYAPFSSQRAGEATRERYADLVRYQRSIACNMSSCSSPSSRSRRVPARSREASACSRHRAPTFSNVSLSTM